MKKPTISRALPVFFLFLVLQLAANAQEKVQVNQQTISEWFARNWMWVVGGVVVLILVAMLGRGSSKRRTTTVVKDDLGNVRSVTTTEVKE